MAIPGTLIRRSLEKQGRNNEKNATYLIKDADVWTLRMIIIEHDLDSFMSSIEKKIRNCWININEQQYPEKLKQIRCYENELVLNTTQLFRSIIDCIEERNLNLVTKKIIDFKKETIIFANQTIKSTRDILRVSL
jgi:hypothetical protein